jgi:hypothetical protein
MPMARSVMAGNQKEKLIPEKVSFCLGKDILSSVLSIVAP